MPSVNTQLAFDDAEHALGERLRKLAAETDQLEAHAPGHAAQLARLAVAVGQRCGLHSTDLSALKLAAFAHDLGERKMKRDYLRRPSPLNWEEQLDLWRHPILGEQEAQELKLPRQAQLLVRWHHEWWNGSGYPDGLAGTAIPLGARILRTVDTYCALTADRPQRAAFDQLAAEQKLADQAGIECDPQTVKALLAILAEERATAEMQAATQAQSSFETAQMDAVQVETDDAWAMPVAASNVIEMPSREPMASATETLPETFLEPSFAETAPAIGPSSPVSFDVPTFGAPTLRADVNPPAPPVPPPSPLWARLAPHERSGEMRDESTVTATSVTASPVTPVTLEQRLANDATEEIPIVKLEELAGFKAPTSPLALGSLLPEPLLSSSSAAAAASLKLVPSNNLQVIALSEVPDHFWLVAKWIYEEWWETPDNSISVVSHPLKEHLASTTVPQTFVALVDGKPVGSISLIERDLPEFPELTPWLSFLYVTPEHRGQGIGSRLLEGAFLRAKLQNAEAVYLATPSHNDFFSHLGWQTLARNIGSQRLTVMTRVA